MADYAMPFLIINMGGEMLYILEQRLQAQNIVEEKSLRVLQDVISTMFSEKFVVELFKPQRIYSSSSTRQIFDRLAHSSIMRLNQSSMDKLYDLMTMGCKYQVISCSSPADLHQICLNHLDALRVIVKGNADVSKLVENCVDKLADMFSRLRLGDLYTLRSTLCRFFQDRRVKVSLFLQDHLQAQDGSMIHHHTGKMAQETEVPGTVRYLDGDKLKKEIKIQLPNSEGCIVVPKNIDITKPGRPCDLGNNLYSKDRRKKPSGGVSLSPAKSTKSSSSSSFEPDPSGQAAAKQELNALASMIGASRAKENEKFSIVNLFPDTSLMSDGGGSSERYADIITFSSEDVVTRTKKLEKQFQGLNTNEQSEEEDLLDLMDKQSGRDYDD